MQCPVCKTAELVSHELESGLVSRQCPVCGGQWLPSYQYWKWREQHAQSLPETTPGQGPGLTIVESDRPKLCPECGHILLPYRVGHDLDFSLDHCGNCGGTWFDRNEWELLKSRNLHDDVHFIFSQVWQAQVFQAERRQARERFRLERFGADDLAEIRRIKAWLDSHPHKHALYAYLLHGEE